MKKSAKKNQKPKADDDFLKAYPMIPLSCRSNLAGDGTFKGRWKRKKRGVGKEAINQILYGIVVIEVYFKFERVLSL